MALIECPECQEPVSTEARACPHCGYPLAEKLAQGATPAGAAATLQAREPLAEVRPSWWGYVWYFVFFFLIIPPIIACFRRASTVLRVYPDRITISRGLFSKCYQDYNPRDVRSIDIDQTFLQRIVGVGDITISTAATAEGVDQIKSIPNPIALRELIVAQRGNR